MTKLDPEDFLTGFYLFGESEPSTRRWKLLQMKTVTLHDMHQVQIGGLIESLRLANGSLIAAITHLDGQTIILKSPLFEVITNPIAQIRDFAHEYDLRVSAARCEAIMSQYHLGAPLEANGYNQQITSLLWEFSTEAQGIQLVQLDSRWKEHATCSTDSVWGEQSMSAFPSASYDMEEAIRCLAFERFTAVVFHCMRVVETISFVIMGCLNLSAKGMPGLGANLKAIETHMNSASSVPKELTEIYADLRSHKVAWRNPTMHAEKIYTQDRAKAVLDATVVLAASASSYLREDDSE